MDDHQVESLTLIGKEIGGKNVSSTLSWFRAAEDRERTSGSIAPASIIARANGKTLPFIEKAVKIVNSTVHTSTGRRISERRELIIIYTYRPF